MSIKTLGYALKIRICMVSVDTGNFYFFLITIEFTVLEYLKQIILNSFYRTLHAKIIILNFLKKTNCLEKLIHVYTFKTRSRMTSKDYHFYTFHNYYLLPAMQGERSCIPLRKKTLSPKSCETCIFTFPFK